MIGKAVLVPKLLPAEMTGFGFAMLSQIMIRECLEGGKHLVAHTTGRLQMDVVRAEHVSTQVARTHDFDLTELTFEAVHFLDLELFLQSTFAVKIAVGGIGLIHILTLDVLLAVVFENIVVLETLVT